ncbi:hypothetical protein EK21DRAFT_62966 [Setomelanomma holmii]|uniref:DNA polymerase delta subunit 3 n=1 Tax=Setomelanomma holmii TaxID=210430 RepID=A0A9P4HEG4_9PLEO|nr:hypothetical protein EK21DRAFT_62966 [Setomelanomma holmii]
MLFDFQQQQNAKKPGSVHATYLVTGKKRVQHHTNGIHGKAGDDVAMRSSPFMSSMPELEEPAEEPVKRTAIVLVREEELQKTRAAFDDETSIHMYSLEPGPIENLSVLAACNHEIDTEPADEDPLQRWRMYGSIQNPYIKRRTAKFAPPPTTTAKFAPPPTTTAAKPAAKAAPTPASKCALGTHPKPKETSATAHRGSTSENNIFNRSTPQPSAGPATLKRSDSKSGTKKSQTAGDLFKSFAKVKPKTKEADRSQESTPAPPEDDIMQGMSEDEGDVDDEPEVTVDQGRNDAARKAREDRQEKLRKMMEDDDVDMQDAPPESQDKASPMEPVDSKENPQTEPLVTVEIGRRRGKRRVMKKKKVKDEDGYLVTKEEAVWESFSEEEPDPMKLKAAPNKPSSSAKGKPPGKKGQGSIASFFKKA